MRVHLIVIWALVRRALNEILRVPAAAIPGILAPAIFFLGLTAVFGKAVQLPGFSVDNYKTFILPVSLLQGAGFTGAATGVNLARDMEQGWFDRLMTTPASRFVLLVGIVSSASLRVFLPATFLTIFGLLLGVAWPGVLGLLIAFVLTSGTAAAAACWGTMMALKFKSQQAAPFMQVGAFVAVLFTTAYAPQALLSGWLADVARINPVTKVLEGIRQGFVSTVTWQHTWPAFVALGCLTLLLGLLALRGMRRFSV